MCATDYITAKKVIVRHVCGRPERISVMHIDTALVRAACVHDPTVCRGSSEVKRHREKIELKIANICPPHSIWLRYFRLLIRGSAHGAVVD
jgi:hypothetical protein